jgi:hypothetical protein
MERNNRKLPLVPRIGRFRYPMRNFLGLRPYLLVPQRINSVPLSCESRVNEEGRKKCRRNF